MKSLTPTLLLLVLIVVWYLPAMAQLSGPYLGQTPPDTIARRFPPSSLLATRTWMWHGPPVFSPDGTEMMMVKYNELKQRGCMEMYVMNMINDVWTSPQRVSFSSDSGDNCPVYSPGGDTLWFISNRDGFQKLYVVERTDTGWSQAQAVDIDYESIPGGFMGWSFSMSEDQTLYFESLEGLCRSECISGRYSFFELLPAPVNTGSEEMSPWISPDGHDLLFSSKRAGTFGLHDLYVSFRNPDDSWTEPQNLGNRINGVNEDAMPVISPDMKYLFTNSAKSGDIGYNPYWVDMKALDKFRPLHPPKNDSVVINTHSGWNLLSIPVDTLPVRRDDLFPFSCTSAFTYDQASGEYVPCDTLQKGYGFWLKQPSTAIVFVAGARLLEDTIQVESGWNLVGSLSVPVPVTTITSDPPGMTTSDFFSFNSSYVTSDTIKPGCGYWVKVSEAGSVMLSAVSDSGLQSLPSRIRITPDSDIPPLFSPGDPTSQATVAPAVFTLEPAYPNPFNPTTTIRYTLPKESCVNLKVYNLIGQVVSVLADQVQPAGERSVEWNASNAASGVYFYRLEATSIADPSKTFTSVKKMLLVK